MEIVAVAIYSTIYFYFFYIDFMSNKKDQHFVPKFYLRHFSYERNRKEIGVYNIYNDIFIQRAKLKTQACKAFFYGKDGKTEEALSILENDISKLYLNFKDENYFPIPDSGDHCMLLLFTIITQLRNPYESLKLDKSINSFFKLILHRNELPKEIINNTSIQIPNVVDMAFSNLNKSVLFATDLKYKIIKNETDVSFITSDSPVIKYNQFLETKNWHRALDDVSILGLQIFFPLTPKILILFYDSGIYKVGDKKQKIINIVNKKDIEQLNLLQILNCHSNVFFNDNHSKIELENLYKLSKQYKRGNIVTIKEDRDKDMFGNHNPLKSILRIEHKISTCRLDLSFIKLLTKAKSLEIKLALPLREKSKQWMEKIEASKKQTTKVGKL